MLISELGPKEEKSQAAMTGRNIGWISLCLLSNDCISQHSGVFLFKKITITELDLDYLQTLLLVIAYMDNSLHVQLIRITMCQ